jgi:hypothetical protein
VKSLNNKNFKGKIKNCFVIKKIFKKRIFKRGDFFFKKKKKRSFYTIIVTLISNINISVKKSMHAYNNTY